MEQDSSRAPQVRIAYLVNQYPLPSHSFIRREIHAVEAAGVAVERYSMRPTRSALPDPGDQAELARTTAILDAGALGLFTATLATLGSSPGRFLGALRSTWALWRCSGRGPLVHLAYLAEACVFKRLLARSGARHVHAHFASNSATVAMLCRELGGPSYSFMVHGPDDFDRARSLAFDRKVAGAAFVATISDFARSQVLRWSDPDDWSKVEIIRCGLDKSFLDHPATPIGDDPTFVSVGRLCPQKAQALLIEAVHILVQEGRTLKLLLVGDGELRASLAKRVRDLKLEDHVTFTGFASANDVRGYMLQSRALIVASFAEGLPVVVMESLALRRPVIGTRIAAMSELVIDGETGWLIAPGSIEELCSAMRSALDTPREALDAMGEAGAARVAERHDALKEGARLAELVARYMA